MLRTMIAAAAIAAIALPAAAQDVLTVYTYESFTAEQTDSDAFHRGSLLVAHEM